MKKTFLITFGLLSAMMLHAAPDLLFRGELLPGATATAGKAGEKVILTPDYAAAGTCAFWIRPDGWDQTEDAWHFFLMAGKQSKETAYINLFRLPAGKIRLVWSKNAEKKEVTDIFADVPFRSGEWHHFSITWKDDSKGCVIQLYVDGKMISARMIPFQMGKDFPVNWNLGDRQVYRPYSKFMSTLGRIEFHKRVISTDEIAALAAQKFVDGRMTFISRKFVPGSVNRISGECSGAEKLEVVFVSESGKEEQKNLPFA